MWHMNPVIDMLDDNSCKQWWCDDLIILVFSLFKWTMGRNNQEDNWDFNSERPLSPTGSPPFLIIFDYLPFT